MNASRPPRGLGLLVFLAPFCLYLDTMAPTVYGLDSAELATGAWTLGIIHSPGCPLFLLVGHLFTWLPLGDVGWRVNLVSAVSGALAAWFVHATVLRLTGKPWIGVVTAWLLACSYYIWVWSVVAELYAPHLCIVAAILWLATRWVDTRRDGFLWSAAVLAGLGMGNHTSVILVAPGLAWLVFSSEPGLWRQPRRILIPVALALTAFVAVFLYLPLRHMAHPPVDYVRDYFPGKDLSSVRGWFWMVRGGMFDSLFFSVTPSQALDHLRRLVLQLAANFGVAAFLLALLGLLVPLAGPPPRRRFAIACLLWFACHTGFYIAYGALDNAWMYSVSYLVAALGFGLGVDFAHRRLPSAGLPLQAAAGAMVASLAFFNHGFVDLGRDDSARRTGERIMAVMEPRALFIGMWEHVPILEYLQVVEGRRGDVRLANGVFLGPAGSAHLAREAFARGRPVYTTATNLFDRSFSSTPVPGGLCYRVAPGNPNSDTPLMRP